MGGPKLEEDIKLSIPNPPSRDESMNDVFAKLGAIDPRRPSRQHSTPLGTFLLYLDDNPHTIDALKADPQTKAIIAEFGKNGIDLIHILREEGLLARHENPSPIDVLKNIFYYTVQEFIDRFIKILENKSPPAEDRLTERARIEASKLKTQEARDNAKINFQKIAKHLAGPSSRR